MTGGVEELEKAYGLSWINSVGLVSETDAWRSLVTWISSIDQEPIERSSEIPIDWTRVIVGPIGSGKSYLADSVACEAAIRGVGVFRLGEQSDYLRLSQGLAGLTIEARRAEVWRHLEAMADRGGCLVLADHPSNLTEEEQSFAEYVDARLGIISDKREPIAIYALHQARATSAVRRRRETSSTRIEPVNDSGIDRVVDIFRGRVLSPRSLEVLRDRVAKTSRSPGMLIVAVRGDVASGWLRYRGRQWLVDTDLNLYKVEPAHRARVEGMLKLLPREEREFFWALSAHPGYAALEDIAAVTGRSADMVIQLASRLESYGLAHLDQASGSLMVSDAVPERAGALIPRSDRRHTHSRWVERLSDPVHTSHPDGLSQLAFHYQQVGQHRDAMIGYVRAVRLADRLRLREAMHTACERGERLCQSGRARSTESSTGALRRWFVKKRILSYWVEQNYPRILSLTDEFISGPEPLPVSVMPIIAYAMIMSRSPTDSKTFIRRCWNQLRRTSPIGVRLEVMLGLAEHSVKQNQRALSCFARARKNRRVLDTESKTRLFLYTALVMDDLGDRKETRKYLGQALSYARRLGNSDLVAVAEVARATGLFTDGKLTAARRVIADGLRLARRHGLIRRVGQFYFIASAVYYELDDYERALRQLERATRLAEALAQRNRVGMMIIRHGMLHQQMGRLGTASKYIDMALRMSRSIDDPEVALVARLTRLDLALQLHEESISSRVRSFGMDRKLHGDVSRRGWLETLLGDQRRYRGDCAKAVGNYRVARRIYRKAGWNDDAARAMLKEAVTHLELGNVRACENLLRATQVMLGRIENPLVRAETRLVELLLAFTRRDGRRAVLRRARVCEAEREWLQQADLALRIDEALIRVYGRVGNKVGVRNAAERYMRQLRKQIANAMESGVGKRMTSRPDIATLLQELLVLKKKGLLAS
jgi:tetratricopeptide (TPR) repeat protein